MIETADRRIPAAEQALRAAGFEAAVRVDGDEGEIASILAPGSERERLLGPEGDVVADAIRAAGFRYVSVDLSAG